MFFLLDRTGRLGTKWWPMVSTMFLKYSSKLLWQHPLTDYNITDFSVTVHQTEAYQKFILPNNLEIVHNLLIISHAILHSAFILPPKRMLFIQQSRKHCQLGLYLPLYLLVSQLAFIWHPQKSISYVFCRILFLLIDSRSTEEACLFRFLHLLKCNFHGFNICSYSGFTLQGGTHQTSQLWLFISY